MIIPRSVQSLSYLRKRSVSHWRAWACWGTAAPCPLLSPWRWLPTDSAASGSRLPWWSLSCSPAPAVFQPSVDSPVTATSRGTSSWAPPYRLSPRNALRTSNFPLKSPEEQHTTHQASLFQRRPHPWEALAVATSSAATWWGLCGWGDPQGQLAADRGGKNWRVKAQSEWMTFFLHHIFREQQCHFSCPSSVLNNKSHNLLSNCSVPSTLPMLFLSFFLSNSFWLCRAACRILVPWPGMEPTHPRWRGRIWTTRPAGKSPHTPFLVLLTAWQRSYVGPELLPLWGCCQQAASACGLPWGLPQLQRCLLGVAVGLLPASSYWGREDLGLATSAQLGP